MSRTGPRYAKVVVHFLCIAFFGDVEDAVLESHTTLGDLATLTKEMSSGILVEEQKQFTMGDLPPVASM